MGMEARCLIGYMIKVEDVEWDFRLLRTKYDLSYQLPKYLSDSTYGDLVDSLENDTGEFDYDDISMCLGLRYQSTYDEFYFYFTIQDVIKKYHLAKMYELDKYVKEYAKLTGVNNYEDFKYDEYAYMD